MSYYDDASLMFLAGGGAQKDGTAYSVKPVPVYGSDEVTNGDFSTDTNWVKGTGWTISGGTANSDGTQTTNSNLNSQTFVVGSNPTLKLTFDVTNYSAGTLNAGITGTGQADIKDINANGTYSVIVVSSAGNRFVNFVANPDFIGSIDNVSVKEVLVGNGDFTFSRGSNLAATRVDADGLIEKGRENLLTYSNDFSQSAWAKINSSLTSGQSGYDGSSDAWLLTKSNSLGRIYKNISYSGVNTFSIYLKKNDSDWARLYFDIINISAYIDLRDGSFGSTSSAIIDKKIVSLGSGWYRVSIAMSGSGTTTRIYPAGGNNDLSHTSGSIYIQDAQVEVGLAATEVIESGATRGTAGILEDTPRFDYSNGASCPSLLLEPSRTNLVTQSEYFSSSYWTKSGSSVVSGFTSPEGLSNAYKLVATSGTAQLSRQDSGMAAGVSYTNSIYLKRVLGSGVVNISDVNNSLVSVALTTEWQRFEATVTSNIYGVSTSQVQLTALGDEVMVYGAQLELGSYATSYIPNHSGGTITRAADVCGGAGDASTFNDSEGVLYAEVKYFENTLDSVISISDGGNSNRILIGKKTDNRIQLYVQSTTTQVDITTSGTFSLDSYHKFAISYKVNDFKLYIDGVLELSSTSGLVPVGLSQVDFYNPSGSSVFNGKTKQVLVFNTALSDADLAALTTI